MQKVVLGLSLGLVLACAPELNAGAGERCDEASPCGAGLECYRGFCLASEGAATPEPAVTDDDSQAVAADAGTSAVSSARDGGSASGSTTAPMTSANPVPDASTPSSNPGKDAGSSRGNTQAASSTPSSTPAVTGTPATTRDAAASPPPDAGSSTPPATTPTTPNTPTKPTMPSGPMTPTTPVDAGVTADAAGFVPDAALPKLPKDCTLDDCCAEAARGKGEGNEGKGGKKCGCEDPALLRTLTCSVGGVVGGVVGVLL